MSVPQSSSVHQSPAANRSGSMDFSPASQSSSTMSPLYHQQQQQQQHMMYQQQISANQQTPPSGVAYSSQPAVSSSNQQRDPQLQQHSYVHEQQLQQQQQKATAPIMDTSGDFGMQDDLGANIADDCGDFNDLDSIEPMTESGDVGTTLMATHQQQLQQQQQPHISNQHTSQQAIIGRHSHQQLGYAVPAQVHHAAQGYEQIVQISTSNSQQMCGPAGSQSKCAPRQQQQQAPQVYNVQQQQVPQQHLPQQQTSPMQGYSMQQPQQPQMNAAYGVQQPCTSQSAAYPSEQISSPRQAVSSYAAQQHHQQQQYQQQQPQHLQQHQQHHQQQHYQQDQQQQQHQSMCVPRTLGVSYIPSQTTQQQHRSTIRTPPVAHQQIQSTARAEDPQASQLEESPASLGSRPESGIVMTEREKDPINSTIETVVMRALSDQDTIVSPVNATQNRTAVQRPRVVHSMQPSSSTESVTASGKLVTSAMNSVSMKAPHITRSIGQSSVSRPIAHSQQQQQSTALAEGTSTGSNPSPRSLNGRPSSVDGRTSSSSGSALTQQLSSMASSHISRRASTSCSGISETGEDDASASFANGQKDRKMSDSAMGASEQRLNSANYVAQHHLTNGHDPHLMKEFCFVQQPNGLSNCVLSEEERRTLSGAQQQSLSAPQRTPPKNVPRRNRRKADLSQEASPHRDDDDEFFLSTTANPHPMRASFTRRVSIAGGVVVGSSGTAPPPTHFSGVVSVQSAQNNFSATVARQQQHIMKHQPKTS